MKKKVPVVKITTPHAAAELAGAAGILDQLVAFDQERVFVLQRLDGQVGGVGRVDLDSIGAVLVAARAGAAADRLHVEVVAAVGAGAGQRRHTVGAVARGDDGEESLA